MFAQVRRYLEMTTSRKVKSTVCIGTVSLMLLFGAACSQNEDNDEWGKYDCQSSSLSDIDPAFADPVVSKRVNSMITVAKAQGADPVELEAISAIAYAETKFGGKKIPDAEDYDIFSQRIENGLQADPNESTKMMLNRVKSVRPSLDDLNNPAELAAKSARSSDRNKYSEVMPQAKKIIESVGGC